jgi:hypothetical protein
MDERCTYVRNVRCVRRCMAIERYRLIRLRVTQKGGMAVSRLCRKLYGLDQDGEIAHGLPLVYELSKTTTNPAETHGDQSSTPALKDKQFALIDFEIARLTKRKNRGTKRDRGCCSNRPLRSFQAKRHRIGDGISACTALSIFSPLCNSFPGNCALRNSHDP